METTQNPKTIKEKSSLIQLSEEEIKMLPTKEAHIPFKFFSRSSQTIGYVYLSNKLLAETPTLYDQIVDVFGKNNEDQHMRNRDIVWVGNDPKYGGAEYKVRVFEDIGKNRLLVFHDSQLQKQLKIKQDTVKAQDATKATEKCIYIAKMCKH